MDRYELMFNNLIDLGPCKKCEHFKMTYAGTIPTCDDMISVPGQYCHRKGRTFSQCFSIGKYVVCEARDCSGRMYILSLNMYIDAKNKKGWWDVFTLSDDKIELPGMYLCKIKRFAHDKNGNLISIIGIVKKMEETYAEITDKYMRSMYLFSKSGEFAPINYLSKVDSYEAHDFFEYYDYMKGCDKFLVYDKELGRLNEIILAKYLLMKYVKEKISLKEINESITSESIDFFWTTKEFDNRYRSILTHYEYRKVYPLVYKKLSARKVDTIFDDLLLEKTRSYVFDKMYRYEELIKEGKIEEIEPYNPMDDKMDLLDMINSVVEYDEKAYSAKREEEKALKKAKRLERRRLERERKQKEKE